MIRELKQSDVYTIRHINALSLGYDIPLELAERQFMRCTSSKYHILLVHEKNQEVTGYIHAQVYESLYSDSGLNIIGLAVLPEYQGNGIGSLLLEAIENIAKDKGYSFIRLNSAEHRTQAHCFYEQNGFLSDKLQKHFIKYL